MKILTAFAITVIIFGLGVGVGVGITKSKVDDILDIDREARLQLESLELEEKLLGQTPCVNPRLLTENLVDLTKKLAYLESQYDKNDPTILELKEPYTLLEIRHYLKMKKMVEECGEDYSFVLFFYSNNPELIGESEKQGFVLDYIRKKYGNLHVYSFDVDLDIDLMNVLKELYKIEEVPSMIIEDRLYVGFHDKEELEKIFESKQ